MGFGGIDVKSSRVGRGAAAVAVVAVAALGMSGCAAFGGVDGGAVAEGAERPENALPPGVLPPNDPPQPGDARLGPDGHYDYSAPDFVLKNPCDTDAYQVALQKGWQPPAIGSQLKDHGEIQYCGITRDTDGISVFTHRLSLEDLRAMSSSVDVTHDGDHAVYTAVIPGDFGGSCMVGAFTAEGGTGINVGMNAFSFYKTPGEACGYAVEQYLELFWGE